MTAVQLHENIRYVSLSDNEGEFGILVHHDGDYVYSAVEVYDKDSFSQVYTEMCQLRGIRNQLMSTAS